MVEIEKNHLETVLLHTEVTPRRKKQFFKEFKVAKEIYIYSIGMYVNTHICTHTHVQRHCILQLEKYLIYSNSKGYEIPLDKFNLKYAGAFRENNSTLLK